MANKIVSIIPIQKYDFATLQASQNAVVYVAMAVDVSQFKEGDLVARLHSGAFTGAAQCKIEVLQDGQTPDDPSRTFVGEALAYATFAASTAAPAVKIVKLNSAALGYAVAVRLSVTQASSPQNLNFEISIDLVLRD